MPRYIVPANQARAEIEVKRSVFIATIGHTPTLADVHAFVADVSALYADANHSAWAFRLESGPQGAIGSSDDGEPGGTAGRPILAVLEGRDLCQVTAVVTRYFGGTKLGTGGLVRAYGGATREALKELSVTEMVLHSLAHITVDYALYGTLKYQLPQQGVRIAQERFADRAELEILVPCGHTEMIERMLQEMTNGQIDSDKLWRGHRYLPEAAGG